MDDEFKQILMDLRFNYEYKISKGLATHKDYRAERRRLLTAHREGKFYKEAFKKWVRQAQKQKRENELRKRVFSEDQEKKKPQKKIGDFTG